MSEHEDVPYEERKVDAPADLECRESASGALEFTGTCPVCHGRSRKNPLYNITPGTIAKAWPWQGKNTDSAAGAERRMYCACPAAHPEDIDENSGCGAWWLVRIPPAAGTV
ncbi:hypothetical protein [Streptomyces sp. WG-D5]